MYTREHATIAYETTAWGSPCAMVHVRHPRPDSHYGDSTWHLISSVGLPSLPERRSDGQPWSYHVYRLPPGHRGNPLRGEWHGCTVASDLETSIDELLADLGRWEADWDLNEQLGDHLYRLRNALNELEAYEQTPPRPARVRLRWPEVQEAFAQLQAALFESRKEV